MVASSGFSGGRGRGHTDLLNSHSPVFPAKTLLQKANPNKERPRRVPLMFPVPQGLRL